MHSTEELRPLYPPDLQPTSSASPPTETQESPEPQAGGPSPLSPEQKSRAERNKLEAEAKLLAKKFGAELMGVTWVKALLREFKSTYMQEVLISN